MYNIYVCVCCCYVVIISLLCCRLFVDNRHCTVDIVTLLLECGAPIKVKNALGWSPMSEAVSYGDRQISMLSCCHFVFSNLVFVTGVTRVGPR